jgi:hypothetical protein
MELAKLVVVLLVIMQVVLVVASVAAGTADAGPAANRSMYRTKTDSNAPSERKPRKLLEIKTKK